ncbi:C-type lectin domain family 5 member A [Platysternon megacephalum]|uniref:C-type lectin domain family 5 member A n=1 Tax=Platysternon megacephalum TaxID=55544 RepID=A0A4D9DJS4_9SAUR|nr:C-type lectin domain family 5 member A [Platysternon megacephalum]
MNWQLVIPGLIILAIKLVGTSLFIVYFSQIFSTDDSTENSWSSTSGGRTAVQLLEIITEETVRNFCWSSNQTFIFYFA